MGSVLQGQSWLLNITLQEHNEPAVLDKPQIQPRAIHSHV